MKEERKWRDEMDAAFGKTPDVFHRRIEQTLRILQAEQKEEPVVKRKVNGGIALLAALLMISAIGVSYFLQNTATYVTGGQPMT